MLSLRLAGVGKQSWRPLAMASLKTGKHTTPRTSVNVITFWTQRMYLFHVESARRLEAESMAEKAN